MNSVDNYSKVHINEITPQPVTIPIKKGTLKNTGAFSNEFLDIYRFCEGIKKPYDFSFPSELFTFKICASQISHRHST